MGLSKVLFSGAAFALVMSTAFGQVHQVTANDVVIYEKTDKAFFSGWGTPVLEETIVEKTASGQWRYKTKDDFRLFDPISFASTPSLPLEALSYELKVTTEKVTSDFTAGKSWKLVFSAPPSKGSRCPNDIKYDLTATPVKEGTYTVIIDGKDTQVKTLEGEVEGMWSAPDCGQGKIAAASVYSAELGLVISSEVKNHSRRALKEIRSSR